MISERKAEFIEHWNKGLSYAQMATVMPYSKNALYKYSRVLKANGEIQERKRGVKPKATEALLKEAFTLGETHIPTLAQRFGLKENTVQQLLVGLNRGKMPTELAKAVALDLQQHSGEKVNLSEIARTHNTTRQYVWHIQNNISKYI